MHGNIDFKIEGYLRYVQFLVNLFLSSDTTCVRRWCFSQIFIVIKIMLTLVLSIFVMCFDPKPPLICSLWLGGFCHRHITKDIVMF